MAVWQVDENGNAPKNAKVGDTIVTSGGSYEVLDGSKYKGMTDAQLKQAGIGYNPSSGLYSKRTSNIKTQDLALQNTSALDQWFGQANTLAKQQLMSAYNTNISNVNQAYNKNYANLKNQAAETDANYQQSMREAQQDAYYNARATANSAANRGMANSAQAQAAATNAYFAAGDTMANLASNRNTLLDNIYTNLNTLTENYNLQLSELEKNRLADELAAMSNNQLQYLAQIMNIDQYNTNAYNDYRMNQIQMEWQSAEAQKDRDFQARQAALSRSYSGNGNGSKNSNGKYTSEQMTYFITNAKNKGQITEEQANALADYMYRADIGLGSYDDVYSVFQDYVQSNGTRNDTRRPTSSSVLSRLSGGPYWGGPNNMRADVSPLLKFFQK